MKPKKQMSLNKKIKRIFDEVSFILLIIVGFVLLCSFNISSERHTIQKTVAIENLNLSKQFNTYIKWDWFNSQKIISFAQNLEGYDNMYLKDKSWNTEFKKSNNLNSDSELTHDTPEYYAGNIISVLDFYDWSRLITSKRLSNKVQNEFWKNHLKSFLEVSIIISIIYLSYKYFFLSKIYKSFRI